MSRIITVNYGILLMSNEQIAEFTKGRIVKIVINDVGYKEVPIQNLLAAANPPSLFVGSLTADNHNVYIQNIDYVELK